MSVAVAARALATPTKLGVRRCLFGPVNREETARYLKELSDNLDSKVDNISKWNFNFTTDTPLDGRFQWEKVNTPSRVRDGPPAITPKSLHRRPRVTPKRLVERVAHKQQLSSLVSGSAAGLLMPLPTVSNQPFTCSCRLAEDKPAVDFTARLTTTSHPNSCSVEHWVPPPSATTMSVNFHKSAFTTVTTSSSSSSQSSLFNVTGKSAPTELMMSTSQNRVTTRSASRKRKQTRISGNTPSKKVMSIQCLTKVGPASTTLARHL